MKYQQFDLLGLAQGSAHTSKNTAWACQDHPRTLQEMDLRFWCPHGTPPGTPRDTPGTPRDTPGTPRTPPGTPRDSPGTPREVPQLKIR